jgi:RimJ/RimL family protein N-acetyltransferase
LARPHVAEWWDAAASPAELEAEYGPAIDGAAPVRCFIACVGDAPIGFMQDYTPALTHDDGWWPDEHDFTVRGIDQFLADETSLGRGLGTAMVRAFVATLFRDPAVTRVQVDPDPANARAIRCYEKAGFRAVGRITTPDGPALLMYVERSADASPHSRPSSRPGA